MDVSGSGYTTICTPIGNGLVSLGHDVKMIGISYRGQEHWNKFSILPAIDFQDVMAILQNLVVQWGFDIFVVALDIPHQERLISYVAQKFPDRKFKYIGIMPVEAGPLCMSWAMSLMSMDKVFIISQYGTREAQNVGIPAEHLQVGVDIRVWKVPTAEERQDARESLGIEDDEFVVLAMGDNQERKNPHVMMQTYAEFSQGKKTRLIHITREHNPAGARLRDYATELGIHQHYMLIERGSPQQILWKFYAASDAFLNPSKAEGLGLGILEAMAVGLPVVATNCTAMIELLDDGRGYLVDYEYQHRDCFGNGWRYWFSKKHGVSVLNEIYENKPDMSKAVEYIQQKDFRIPVLQMDGAIKELFLR